jgi:mono/diheme cytochrome c family protein
MRRKIRTASLLALSVCALATTVAVAQDGDGVSVERGRYLAKIAGCNDCHTAGYLATEGQVPESEWLMGDTFGWRGPWGTTYGANLRLLLGTMSEEQWLTLARNLTARPPMPWFALNEMTDEDLRSLYAFIRYLGPAGEPAPAYVPPDQEPPLPYALFPSPPPEEQQAAAP